MDGASVVALRRSPENQDLISTFELRAFHPNMGVARLASALGHPVTGERMAFEVAVYCAYRRNPAYCEVLQRHLDGGVAYPWIAGWLPRLRARQVAADVR